MKPILADTYNLANRARMAQQMTHGPVEANPTTQGFTNWIDGVGDALQNPGQAFLGAASNTFGFNPGFGSADNVARVVEAARGHAVPGDRDALQIAMDAWGPGAIGKAVPGMGGRIGNFDPRFDARSKELDRLRNLDVTVEGAAPNPDMLSIADFEGRPFISSMSDRTRADGTLTAINGQYLDTPVELLGGQDYMFRNPGQVWASGAGPVNQIHGLAQDIKRLTGDNPIYLPWRMAPTGGDFAHMTGETMLSHAAAGMNKKNRSKANTAIKKLIPGWGGIGVPGSIDQFRNAPDSARKQIKQMLDVRFRGVGGLGIGEARLAVADPNQLMAKDSGLMNIGEIHPNKPIVQDSGHPSYPRGVPGEGLGRLQEDINIFQLLPDVVNIRGMDALSPRATDIRAMQMKPYAGVITEDILKNLGF